MVNLEQKMYRDYLLDVARTHLYRDLLKGMEYAIVFVLKTLDKSFIRK